METNIELKAIGNNGSGKTLLLEKISDFLECENLNIKFSSEDEHKLIVSGEICEVCENKEEGFNYEKVGELENKFDKLLAMQAEQLQILNKNMDLMVTLLGEISGSLRDR